MTKHIKDLLAAEKAESEYISFEFFPPRTEKGEEELMRTTLPAFVAQSPIFLDITWGAGGKTSTTTMRVCKELQERYPDVPINMHITCTNMPKGLIKEGLDFARANGISNIVALRGDPPTGEEYKANPDGFQCALDLIKYIRQEYGDYFCISAAGYPEGHPARLPEKGQISPEAFHEELVYLKEKVDAGADLIITQLFYDADIFIHFVKECRAMGITVPILPGLLPVTSYASLMRMVNLCKTYVPTEMSAKIEELKENPEELKAYGVRQMVDIIQKLKGAGIGCNHYHFYTVNAITQTFSVLRELGLLKA